MTATRAPLKDQLFNREKVGRIAAELERAHPAFDSGAFTGAVMARLPDLELKQRISWIAACLAEHLPPDYRRAVGVLLAALPAPADPDLADGDFGDFVYAPYGEFIANHGCSRAHLLFSLEALRTITTRFSAEFAIRPFLDSFPDETYAVLETWTRDEHYHVRRLCSEGTRPRLPWAPRLSEPPERALPILDELFADRTRFVTRSVANHLNDLAKVDPALTLRTLERWRDSGRQDEREMAFIVRHATRGLIKAGHPGAMRLLGIVGDTPIEVLALEAPPQVRLDDSLAFTVALRAAEDCEAIIDYALHSPAASAGRTTRKVYKLRRIALRAGQAVEIGKRHALRSDMTTRTIRPGTHRLEIIVNGGGAASHTFIVA